MAFVWFGAATLLVTLLVQYRVYWPEMGALKSDGGLGTVRQILPTPFPSVELNALFVLLWGLAIVAPIVAGWMTGSAVLVRPVRSVWQAQTTLTLYTFVLGIQLLPTTEGLMLALFQLFYWLPVGCFTAHLAAHLTIMVRRIWTRKRAKIS